jgi:antitoxin Phd
MEDVSTAEARKNLADLLNKVAYAKEHVVVRRRGQAIAAIVPIEDLGLLERLRGLLERDEIARAIEELDAGASIPWEELRRKAKP